MNDDHRRATNIWSRRIHVYTSMITLVVVLFFGLTGLTLNHPDWTFGDQTDTVTDTGALPPAATATDGSADLLAIAEYVRATYGVSAPVADYQTDDAGRGSIAFKRPGYVADVIFDAGDGTYTMTIEQQGWVAVLNDLHKGRDAGSSWSWVIDLTAGFLVVISGTGLLMQVLMRKRRRPALTSAAVGGLVTLALMAWVVW